jgi:hypothetical protein
MRCPQRLIAASVLIALSCALGGCAGGLGSFDPTDLLDFLDTKKKLPGDRKPVFPEGVPGLEQGVPKELYKGSRQEQIDQQNAGAAAPPAEEPKAKHAGKSKGKNKPPAAASTEPAAAPAAEAASEEDGSTAAAPPAPKPSKMARKRTTAPPQDQQPPQSAPSQQQSAGPFPAPLPSGTFAR